jgi:hypothetical protein
MTIHRNKEWDWMDEVESRPWGMYEVLLDSDECKVKLHTYPMVYFLPHPSNPILYFYVLSFLYFQFYLIF